MRSMTTDCVDTRICFSRDDLASLVKNLIPLIKQDSSSNSETGTSTETRTRVITQMMQDMANLSQVERPLSTGTVLNNVLTYYTNNIAPTVLNRNTFEFNWMGIARLYLSPLNIGYARLQSQLVGSYSVDWIRVKLLNVTFSKSVAKTVQTLPIQRKDDLYAKQETQKIIANDEFLSLDGTTYTLGYRPATYLMNAPGINTQRIGNAFVREMKSETSNVYGIGFTTPSVTGLDTQFDGDYASTFPEAKTEPLGTSSEILIRSPQAMSLYLTSTEELTMPGIARNTYKYSRENPLTFRAQDTLAFQEQQGSEEYQNTESAVTPIYGLVQIDLPEDLFQEVYQKVEMTMKQDNYYDDQENYGIISKTQYTTNTVLNANYKILVEYGVHPVTQE